MLEPGTWPGNPARPVDDTNLGKYLFEVLDRKTNRVVYSRGFASIFGEWETTGEAQEIWQTFHESLRFPAPASPVQVVLNRAALAGAAAGDRAQRVALRKGRLPDPRRRLHRGRAGQVREGRPAPRGPPVRHQVPFCRVCQRAIERVIDLYTRPAD